MLVSLSLLAVLAQGPAPRNPEETINTAFANLASDRDVVLTQVGTTRLGSRIVPFRIETIWRRSGELAGRTLRFAMRRYEQETLVAEARGNGDTLVTYDYVRRTYSATPYHVSRDSTAPNRRDDKYELRLQSALTRSFGGSEPATYAVRILREAMSVPSGFLNTPVGPVARYYSSWIPGRVAQELPGTLPPTEYTDPVVPKEIRAPYVPTDERLFFGLNDRNQRSVVFEIFRPESGPLTLETVYFGQRTPLGERERLVEWTMRVARPIIDPANVASYEASFAALPAMPGWRPVVSAQYVRD